jgi:hypothetical protein
MHNGINMVITDSIHPQEPAFCSGSPRAVPLCLLFRDFIMMIIMTPRGVAVLEVALK